MVGKKRERFEPGMSMKPLPYNACDYRCERCLDTAECAVFQKLQEHSALRKLLDRDDNDLAAVFDDIRASFRETENRIKQKARTLGIDIDELAGGTSALEVRDAKRHSQDDPLYQQSRVFMMETHAFLLSADQAVVQAEKEHLDDIAWHHTVVPAKVYRATAWRADDDTALDGKTSAAVAMKSLTICIMAFDHLASRCPVIAKECASLSAAGRRIREELKKRYKLGRIV